MFERLVERQFVPLEAYLPKGSVIDMRYASDNNRWGKAFYVGDETEARLIEPAAIAAGYAGHLLAEHGLYLKVWDALRPLRVQKELTELEALENPENVGLYVLGENESKHPLGEAFDGTIVDENQKELDMGVEFDEFGPKAWPSTREELTEEQLRNRDLLAFVMGAAGFKQYPYEMWHFDFVGGVFIPKSFTDSLVSQVH